MKTKISDAELARLEAVDLLIYDDQEEWLERLNLCRAAYDLPPLTWDDEFVG
jgi:hypothetical protein